MDGWMDGWKTENIKNENVVFFMFYQRVDIEDRKRK